MAISIEDNYTSAIEPDWERERPRRFWDPGRKLLLSLRTYQKWKKRKGKIAKLICKYCVFRHIFWSTVSGADIPLNCNIGGGLLIPHPNGIVIHPDAIIGVNCLINHQVTIGTTRAGGVPEIKGHVDIGAGAKIIGSVVIEDHVQIGANAVVTKDVAKNEIVVGIPAKVVSSI
ncbi:serine acetyltransferase [Spirochaeta isovalerica]|uniref:Serine acetyltransferase n=1 Tax=Spirochaeta isovalerica TaxID=150 RepID=A0A841R604_9SPIO|nr:serine acetyltransferase [Spirochaeta isovalerica]MBB6479263.1 serine O-acetyltransferase [Spirochaeta isovalerica]